MSAHPLTSPSTSSAATTTPMRAKHAYPMSPAPSNTAYTPTLISGGLHQKLNVVTRVAIEGKAKQNKEGASIRLYLKISVPLDNMQPGSTIPLFPEENVKILTSQVHPLNNHSVPYNFSSTVSPLLHNAARALNLPARSTETFNSAFSLTSLHSTSSTSPADGVSENIATVDSKYTGHILVSGYHISFVLPKLFPTRPKNLSETESEGYARKHRRMSVGERGSAHFMAAIDMVVPYVSIPPRSPYLLSIPVPRCLHNNIKLRIFPPTVPSASMASLSSIDEESNSWDLTSDPHVTRSTSSRPSRSNSYTHFADDESSDSSTTGFLDGCGIQGTFPSTERIRIRWAKPIKNIDVPDGTGDDRRRVGVRDVKGEMSCIIRGKAPAKGKNGVEGLLVDVAYKGTCRGVWFPGVATLLGLDVSLETKGSDAYWVEGSPNSWDINGETGLMGFDTGALSRLSSLQSRTASMDSNSSTTPQTHVSSLPRDASVSRHNSSSSTSSLLRAPLPGHALIDYSFEGSSIAPGLSSNSSSALSMSSVRSLTPGSSLGVAYPETPPGHPITLHVNMNEIIAPAKNIFTFSIKGTILVVARPTSSRSDLTASQSLSPANSDEDVIPDVQPIVLPRFTVLAADHESVITTIQNDVQDKLATLEVYNSTEDRYRDAQSKTVLQPGNSMKCNHGSNKIALRSTGTRTLQSLQAHNELHTPTKKNISLPRTSSQSPSESFSRPLAREGPRIIPSMSISVTPLLHDGDLLPKCYAVRVCLNVPPDPESEWFEFGLAQQDPNDLRSPKTKEENPPRVVITSATIDGAPVMHETVGLTKPEASGLGAPFDQTSEKKWIVWVRIHVGTKSGGGSMVVDYVASEHDADLDPKGKPKLKSKSLICILLPTFSIPVGRLEVQVEASGVDIASLRSNLNHQHPTSSGIKLLNFSMEEFFYPNLYITVRPITRTQTTWRKLDPITLTTWALIIVGFIFMHRIHEQGMRRPELHEYAPTPSTTGDPRHVSESVTITTTVTATATTTVYTSASTKWWQETTSTPTSPIPTDLSLLTSAATLSPSQTNQPSTADQTPQPEDGTPSTDVPRPLVSLVDQYSLSLPISNLFNFTWPTHDFHATVERVMQTLDNVWHILRKVYHYPLDPP